MNTDGPEDDLDLDLDLDQGAEPAEVEDNEADDEGSAELEKAASKDDGYDDEVATKPTRNRAERRIETLANEAKRAREEAAELRRKVDEMATQRTQAPAVDPELERRRYEMMTTEERVEYRLAQAEQQHRAAMAQVQFQMQDQADKGSFLSGTANDPRRAKMADKVEGIYREFTNRGQFISRETIYFHELGKLVASQSPKARDTAKKESAERVRRQTVPAGSSRGDVPQNRGRGRSFEEVNGDVLI